MPPILHQTTFLKGSVVKKTVNGQVVLLTATLTHVEMNDLVAAGPGSHGPISIELEDSELWKRFHHQTNEMIVTKGGRRMFPLIKVKIKGLEPRAFYSILLEFKQIENNRWKYINGEWLAGMQHIFNAIKFIFINRQPSILCEID